MVQGRYCHICGQENIVPKQSFWGLTKHFVYDIFHFDGKFFETLRLLFFRPGTISREYVKGKRMKYLDPIRMYLFTSAIFFLFFFSVKSTSTIRTFSENETLTKAERLDLAMQTGRQQANHPEDSVLQQQMALLLDSTYVIGLTGLNDTIKHHSIIEYKGKPYKLTARKDSALLVINDGSGGWFDRFLTTKMARFKEKYSDDPEKGLAEFLNDFVHKLPYLLFLSLPFFAGILKLLNLRRKEYLFSDHAVFTLHHYIISFILFLLFLGFDALGDATGWGIFKTLSGLMFLLWPLYLLVGMKRFYQQRWSWTLGKFLLVNILGLITLLFLMGVFLFFSIFQL